MSEKNGKLQRENKDVKVNAFTQWGKLKRIMVGTCDNANFDIW
jgi:hypothetical protein